MIEDHVVKALTSGPNSHFPPHAMFNNLHIFSRRVSTLHFLPPMPWCCEFAASMSLGMQAHRASASSFPVPVHVAGRVNFLHVGMIALLEGV